MSTPPPPAPPPGPEPPTGDPSGAAAPASVPGVTVPLAQALDRHASSGAINKYACENERCGGIGVVAITNSSCCVYDSRPLSWISNFVASLDRCERAVWRAELGVADLRRSLSAPGALVNEVARSPRRLLLAFHHAAPDARYPGRAEALLAVARSLGERLPQSEYALAEDGLATLLERARLATGQRIPLSGARGHKGRVGDGVERLLLGQKTRGKKTDHPAAEIKSVPVSGDRVLERVKLGVISRGSNPLAKCERVLFVFVERRGTDHFVRGHHLAEFDRARFADMWQARHLVETAAGKDGQKTRGLYLVPKWFRSAKLWPPSPG